MTLKGKQVKLCSCNKTMSLDAGALSRSLQLKSPVVIHNQLCRGELDSAAGAIKSSDEVVVACTQEASLFDELAREVNPGAHVSYVNIREAGGWSAQGDAATAKIAALLAAAGLPEPEPVPTVSYRSHGRLLIIGNAVESLPWAERLAEHLEVSVLLTDSSGGTDLPALRRYPVISGRLVQINGYLGAFEVSWEQTNPIDLEACTRCNACVRACPEGAINDVFQVDLGACKSHRECVAACGEIEAIDFNRTDARRSEKCDLLLDLSATPYLDRPQPPQGYFAPGADPTARASAVAHLVNLVGEFEKPKYFSYRADICAHGRSRIVGCSQCIDVCSTRAISSDGDHITVEPHLCMGCGACATVCPSGALGYTFPRVSDMGLRLKVMLRTYHEAGGGDACVLLHDIEHGRDLIARLARRGKGLPARVIPLDVFHIASVGLELMLGAIAYRAVQVLVLATGTEAPQYLDALERQMGIAQSIISGLGFPGVHFKLIRAADPIALEAQVWQLAAATSCEESASFNLSNEKRTTLGLIFDHLQRHAPSPKSEIPLPHGAPYGRVNVDHDACTLCMACVGACPESALRDSPDVPRLSFIEYNCVQCGLCEETCPENAVTLTPRLLLSAEARRQQVINEAEIFNCIGCGKPLATKPVIDKILSRLESHSMFSSPEALNRLKLCADCRVIDMMKSKNEVSVFDIKP